MVSVQDVLAYLKANELVLTTAESCTAGRIIHLLSKHAGSGESLDAGLVVYSEQSKKRLLKIKQETIDTFTLTSEEVAREMVAGAFQHSDATVVIATTGIAGSKPMDGKKPGTVCFAFGFKKKQKEVIFSETKLFSGKREQVQDAAALHALIQIPFFHQKWIGNHFGKI